MAEPTTKPAWASKTMWVALATAVAPLVPPFQEWIKENNDMFIHGLGIVFLTLRVITKGKVSIT